MRLKQIQKHVVGVIGLFVILFSNLTVSAGTVQCRYDRLNRVMGAVSEEGMVFEYDYDEIGNRVGQQVTAGRTLYTIMAIAGEHGAISPAGAVMVGRVSSSSMRRSLAPMARWISPRNSLMAPTEPATSTA